MVNLIELKSIADGLAEIGKPGHDDKSTARRRLALMERFTRLVKSATQQERHELVAAFKSMLADIEAASFLG